jgi:hypothetical protein
MKKSRKKPARQTIQLVVRHYGGPVGARETETVQDSGIPVVEKFVREWLEGYGVLQDRSHEMAKSYFDALDDLSDDDVIASLSEARKRYTGDGRPSPGFVREVALKMRSRPNVRVWSEETTERRKLAWKLARLHPKGKKDKPRNLLICGAHDGAHIPNPWGEPSWVQAYNNPALRNKVQALISEDIAIYGKIRT